MGDFLLDKGDRRCLPSSSGELPPLKGGVSPVEKKEKTESLPTSLVTKLPHSPKIDRGRLPEHPVKDVISSIGDVGNLLLAYEIIKSKPGNMTPGLKDRSTLDSTKKKSLAVLDRISDQILNGTYKFSPARRVWIPKHTPKGAFKSPSMRPLNVGTPRDKIVQKAIVLVLEPLFEPKFYQTSHGFRPQRGTHTALKMIDQQFKSVN